MYKSHVKTHTHTQNDNKCSKNQNKQWQLFSKTEEFIIGEWDETKCKISDNALGQVWKCNLYKLSGFTYQIQQICPYYLFKNIKTVAAFMNIIMNHYESDFACVDLAFKQLNGPSFQLGMVLY